MLSFNSLGNLGRLGNQMFQYASLKGIAANRGFEITIPPRRFFGEADENVANSDVTIYESFKIGGFNTGLANQRKVSESTFGFDEELFNTCEDNVDLIGYFQNEKYFEGIEDKIRKEFTFKSETLDPCREFVSQFDELISLHIRRGDYTVNVNHPVQPMEYYAEALKLLPKTDVIVFSDDPDWCHQQELFSDDRFIVSQDTSSYHDLYMMSKCSDFIIANSSFSWWGAWLANTGRVIAPSKWFGPNNAHLDTKDLYPEHWEII